MQPIQVQLLGPPEITYHRTLCKIQRQTPRAIFYYLAAQDTLVARDTLLEIFWPETGPAQARRRLRVTLSRLRGELPLPEALITSPDIAGLQEKLVEVDLRIYHQLLRDIGDLPWKIPVEMPIPAIVVQKMDQAAALWQGSHFLEGARLPSTPGFDAWLSSTDTQLTEQQIRLLTRLAQHQAASGQLEEGLTRLELAYQLDDLNEELAAQIISWRIELGQRAHALEFYETVAARLADESGLAPGPALTHLRALLEVDDISLPAPLTAHLSLRPSLELPFVGREQAMQTLESAFYTGGSVLIQGESGSGKTRLILEFSKRRLTNRRMLVLQCRPTDTALPLQPFAEALRSAIHPADWQQLDAGWIKPLANWLPELRHQADPSSMPDLWQAAVPPQQLQEAIRQVIMLIGTQQKLAVVVDDLHWADEATITTLAYLVNHTPEEQKSLLILSSRLESPNPYLEAWLPHLVQQQNFSTVTLQGMDQKELLALSLHTFGLPVPNDFAEKLLRTTGGNPYFALETMRLMLENGISPLAPDPTLPTPATIQDMLTSRLQLVSMAAGKFLAVAAVVGQQFDTTMVRVTAELNPVQSARVLEELEQRALIEAIDQNDTTHKFTHTYIREAVLASLHPARKLALQQKIQEYTETRHPSE
ncbi:MAG: ATP-binding protein [Anaerolineales bacterium]|jgi:DNA-binding SARP family transcriptional activator